jgi:adenylate cyclase
MKIHFQQQLGEELLKSERRRIIIVISIFLFLLCYRVLQGNFFEVDLETKRIQSSVVWLFPFLILLFELLSLWYVNKQIKSKANKIPLFGQYLNTALEICIPSLIILTIAKQFPTYNILKSPALSVYFIFIILSTLRLNFFLSFFCGLLSAVSYFVAYFFFYDHFDFNDASRAIILLVSGIAAGLVAAQIKNGINKSVRETERRHRVENLFGQQISMEIAEKILENNGEIESKRMTVAIMFVDIRNFTNFAATRTPEQVVQYQNAFFTLVSNAVAQNAGIVNQFLGDGCMVTFGAPAALDNPALHAVRAAIEIREKLREEVNAGHIADTSIGIGIHTGDAVTGNIGTDARQQYSVTGKCVIVAARVEQLNKEFNSQILITQEVFNQARPHITVVMEDLGKIGLKGFDEPYVIHKVA